MPRTSYGYQSPRPARVRGWYCTSDLCGVRRESPPASWPYACPECGHPADPWFAEPWEHEAAIYEYRHRAVHDIDPVRRQMAEAQAHVWAYKDAGLRGDRAGLRDAWRAWCKLPEPFFLPLTMVMLAADFEDFDGAAEYVLERHPLVDTRDLQEHNQRRTEARNFLSMCIELLERESFAGHPREAEIDAAMRDIARRAADVLTDHHQRGFQRIRELRDRRRFRAALRRTRAERVEGLPPVGDPEGNAAIERADLHDDFGPLDDLIARRGTALLRARRHVLRGDLRAALGELTDHRPETLATRGLLVAREDLDRGTDLCRAGRRAGRTWWRRTTPADGPLARLLLVRALSSGGGDLAEAVRLVRHVDDPLLRQEVLAARDALTGRGSAERRQVAWRTAADAPGSPAALARLALAWAEWAAGTGVPGFAAEAYERLVALAARDATGRQGTAARDRVLLAAQEYAEEAGYWLARAGRFREAVLALERGRAVALSSGEGEVGYEDITAQTGDGAIVYLAAAHAGGYALVVAATHDPQYIDLPGLDRPTVAALTSGEPDPAGFSTRLARDLTPPAPAVTDPMTEGLRLLWRDGLRDVVLLSARGRVVTLIPIGLLTLLPLHAAGGPAQDGDHWHIARFSAIRYAPNVRTLARCRASAARLRTSEQTLLAVDAPDGHGSHLQHVARETTEVTRRWTGRAATAVHGCTWAEFRDAAERHTVWHLACHGDAEPEDIYASRLFFADRAVTLAEVAAGLEPHPRRLAVLSACHTNLVGSALPNEVVGLPSALLQLGFAGVIATGWAVDDLATTYLMTAFYRFWCADGDEPAVALHRARHWLRTATRADLVVMIPEVVPPPGDHAYAEPRFWAAFAYTGA
ncbi:CHAT domain-containing protein [Couchioplanes caeruleus]|uniref:CHAT domain-containing protein n=1 Tax=Couchioplanes caeruleus TaxID=56438 RepID=UPI0020BFB428|nr:CHAT domain-containing protein [Couchioplanes caeruleus]UQU63999.1 CHAT domain-containing protein [Couchioplanes caeruleus]